MLLNYLAITVGAFIYAFGLNYFIVGNQLAEGGITGLAIILHYLFGAPIGLAYFVINIPLFFMGVYFLGRDFAFKTIYGISIVSLFIQLTSHMAGPVDDLLLAAIYGGTITGLGLGIIFKYGGTTGGSDIIGRLLHRARGIGMGETLFSIDVLVIGSTAFLFGKEIALYSLVGMFIASRIIDALQEGIITHKALMIISEKEKEIQDAIFTVLDRGVTVLNGQGGYTGQERRILYCVVSRREIPRAKELITAIDPNAFVVLTDAREVLGTGFKPHS